MKFTRVAINYFDEKGLVYENIYIKRVKYQFYNKFGENMSDKEYEEAKKEREIKDKKVSIIVFSLMAVSLLIGLVYIVVNR